MDFITRGDRDLEHTELLYGRKSDQCVLNSILLNAEKEMKGNNGLRLGKQCKKEYIVITFVCDGNIVMFKHPNLPKLLYIGFKLIPQIPYKIGV